jgi:hypothetical protein
MDTRKREAAKRKKARARVRHQELRYCVTCGLKASAEAGVCPNCGLPLTARTREWKSAALASILAQSEHPIHQAHERHAVRRAAQRQQEEVPDGRTLYEVWLADQPGHPLGVGVPLGATLRMDGESHSNAWRRILRSDPCAYCGAPISGTVDHVEPRHTRRNGVERWINLVGACSRCNGSKAAKPLLLFLLAKRSHYGAHHNSATLQPRPIATAQPR